MTVNNQLPTTKNERVEEVFDIFIKHMQDFFDEAKLNHEEYTNFVNWADRLGKSGELPLYADVFLETHVLQSMYTVLPGTQPSLLGPYYVKMHHLLKRTVRVLLNCHSVKMKKVMYSTSAAQLKT